MYHSCTSKTTSLIKTIKGARSLPTLRLEEGDCAPIFVQIDCNKVDDNNLVFEAILHDYQFLQYVLDP